MSGRYSTAPVLSKVTAKLWHHAVKMDGEAEAELYALLTSTLDGGRPTQESILGGM
jgi:hypothetical protein